MRQRGFSQRPIHARRRGIATFFAVAALGLVATAVLAMSTMLTIDHRRTRAAVTDAQLRQLLIAGADVAATHAEPGLDVSDWRVVQLPKAFSELGGGLKWCRVKTPDARASPLTVLVVAEYGGQVARQRVTLGSDNGEAPRRPISAEWLP
ncbi:MAG: hypothetical protein AAF333_00350 [Planctomycetota bacterium]